jgi:hypothetical protein
MLGNDCPGNIFQIDVTLLPLLDMARVNGAMQFNKGFCGRPLLKLAVADAVGALDGVHLNLCGFLN